MSIFQFFRIILARWAIIAITLSAALVAAIMVIKLVPPQYEARSRVMLDLFNADPVTGESMAANSARAFISTQSEMIRDYRVVGRVVDRLGWTGSAVLSQAYQQSGSEMDFRRWLAQRIIDNTTVQSLPNSNILEIVYSGNEPEAAAIIADALREAYEDQTILFRQQGATRNAQWFRRQTTELRAQLTAAEQRKADFERANGVLLNDDATDADSARLNALAASPPPMAMTTAGSAVPITSPSQAQLAQLDAAIASASQQLGPNHPDLQNLQRQRAALAASAAQELSAARAAAAAAQPRSTGPSAAAMFDAQRSRVLAQRGNLAEARQLLNEVTSLRAQLARTSERAVQLEQESQATETGLTRLGSATAPDAPSFPKTIPVLLGAIALGLGLGLLLALLVELLNRRVRSVDDLLIDDVPVIGILPSAAPRRLPGLTRLLPRPA